LRTSSAELHVIDNGPGVWADALERLFDGFCSLKEGGNGIGLSSCMNIVARHGGRIWAQRSATGGLDCRFAVPLPLLLLLLSLLPVPLRA